MALQQRLGVVKVVDIVSVPVRVNDGTAVFEHDGQLTAIFDDIKPDTVISWYQYSGIPVTFTSPLNEETITFTGTDLDKKVFVCCTNPGTDSELCASAEFYHFPVDFMQPESIIENKGNTTINHSLIVSDSAIKITEHNGMLSVNPVDPVYSTQSRTTSVSGMLGYPDLYGERLITYTMDDGLRNSLYSLEEFVYDDGEWVLSKTYPSSTLVMSGITETTRPSKLVFTFYVYGHLTVIEKLLNPVYSPGATEVVPDIANSSSTTVGNMTTLLSKNTAILVPAEVLPPPVSKSVTVGTLVTILQNSVFTDVSDSVTIELHKGYTNGTLTTNLQSSITVT